MSGIHKAGLRAFLCIAMAALLFCAVLFAGCSAQQETSSLPAAPAPSASLPAPDSAPAEPLPEEPAETIPVDFEALQQQNPDIYAWLSLPDAGIDHPVLRREGSDDYYLRLDVDGNYAIGGSLYTQASYNSADFSDPVTIIYGHSMDDGSMFGRLQAWCQDHPFGADTVFTIYQPGRRLTYRVFAAVPYDNTHVLYYNDFSDESAFRSFFEDRVFAVRDLQAVLDPSFRPEYGQNVVMLSTCLRGDSNRRYLVMGLLAEDVSL